MQHIQPRRGKFMGFEKVAHLCYYNPTTRDLLSQKVIAFKNGDVSANMLWCAWALGEIANAGWGNFDFVIRSLSSGELEVLPTIVKPLDKLGNALASGLSAKYFPQILQKSATTRPMHSIPTAPERWKELSGKYTLSDSCPDLNGAKILIIDDVTTAGTTLDTISYTIKSKYKANLYGFCLAQTNREISNDSINHPFNPPPNKTPLSEMFS